MKSKTFPISPYRGDTWLKKITIVGDGNPVDITGWKFTLTLKSNIIDTDAHAALQFSTIAGSLDVDDASHGIVWLVIDADITYNISPGIYYYDIQIIDLSIPPRVQTFDAGRITVLADITRTAS